MIPALEVRTFGPVPAPPIARSTAPPFREVLRRLCERAAEDGKRLDDILGGRGRAMSLDSLLALQATVYRYSQAVELASKLVDKASSCVRTALQAQS
jgi:hypothetical protein